VVVVAGLVVEVLELVDDELEELDEEEDGIDEEDVVELSDEVVLEEFVAEPRKN